MRIHIDANNLWHKWQLSKHVVIYFGFLDLIPDINVKYMKEKLVAIVSLSKMIVSRCRFYKGSVAISWLLFCKIYNQTTPLPPKYKLTPPIVLTKNLYQNNMHLSV